MRNAALAVWITLALAVCLFHGAAAFAQTKDDDERAITKFWDAAAQAVKGKADLEKTAFHWVFLVSTSGLSKNAPVAQSERNFLRGFAARELYVEPNAWDIVSLIPYQNSVRVADVHRLMRPETEADAHTIATCLPSASAIETNVAGIKYDGGHDTEAAIAWALDPNNKVINADERNFILVVIGATDRSNPPNNADATKFQSYLERNDAEYEKTLSDYGLSRNPVSDFKANYSEDGKTWPIYVSIYLPEKLTGKPFAAARAHKPQEQRIHNVPVIPPAAPPVPDSKQTPTSVPAPTPPTSEPKQHTVPPPPINPGTDGGSSSFLPILFLGLFAAIALAGAGLYFRPAHLDVQVGNTSSKEQITLNLRNKTGYIYGPGTKDEEKSAVSATLKAAVYDQFPAGKLAEVTYAGGKKVRVKGTVLCDVKGLDETPDGSVVLKPGEVEKLTFIAKQNDVRKGVEFELHR